MTLRGEVRIVKDAAGFADTLERITFQALAEAMEERGAAFALLAGGNTPRSAYELMAGRRRVSPVPRSTNYFLTDERAVEASHADSNGGMVARALLNPLGVPNDFRYFPDGSADLRAEAARLTGELRRVRCNADGVPAFDIAVLGMGADGHTASLFPGSPALDEDRAAYVAVEVPATGARRISVTFPLLNAARLVVVACLGGGKTAVLREISARASDAKPVYPIERVCAKNIIWLMDEEAAP